MLLPAPSDGSSTIQNLLRPRGRKTLREAQSLSDLSRVQMGNWFVIQQRFGKSFRELRREFSRRYWLEQEQRAEHGAPLRLYPFDR
jgi:hypothetical protein